MSQFGKRSRLLAALIAGLFVPAAFAQDGATAGTDGDSSGTLTGDVTVMHIDDFENDRCETFYQITDSKTSKTYNLKFPEGRAPRHLKTGMKVKAKGKKQDSELVLAEGDEAIQAIINEPPTAALVSGEKRALVILLNFLDAPNSCTPAQVQSLMFGSTNSVKGLYQELSSGALNLTGTVVGPYTINYYTSGACDTNGWAAAADAAAQAAGVSLAGYTNKVYVLPNGNTCSWGGLGSVGGSVGRTWINSCGRSDVYAHELGHNFSMMHSSTDANNDGVSDCEYCDVSDIMGYGGYGLRHVNAPHKEQMGWLPTSKILTPTVSGTYQIAPLELNPSNTQYPQAIKIARPGTNDSYYVSYRRKIGYDAGLSSNYAEAVNIHRYAGGTVQTFHIKTLTDGANFSDSANNITVTQVSRTPDYVTVQVQIGSTPAPTRSAPAVTLAPATQTGNAGATLSYTVTVKNQDGTGAPASTFALTPGFPSTWTGTVSPASLTLQPGQSGTATLTVTSPATATAGSNTVGVTARDSAVSVHTASGSATYTVQAPAANFQAPAVSLSPSAQTGRSGATLSYTLSVANRDGSGTPACTFSLAPTLPSGWTGTVSPASLTLQPGQTGTATLSVTSPAATAGGMFTVGVRTSDPAAAVHTATASATYAVESPATAAPTVTLSPATQTGQAGASLSYTVTVANRDAAGNPAATFALTSSLPSGWTGTVSPASLTLQPGQSGTATLQVTSTAGAGASNYTVGVTARDSAVAVHAASGSATYTVQAPPTTPTVAAPAVSLSPNTQSGVAGTTLRYTLTVTNRDGAGSPASTFSISTNFPSGFTGSVTPYSLTLQPGQTGTVAVALTSRSTMAAATYGFSITAWDYTNSVHRATATATCTVQQQTSTPAPAAPTVSLSPSTQSARAGSSLSYTLTVTNRDEAGSAAATFSLSPTGPAGWTGTVSPTSLTLQPGQSGTASLEVTAPATAGASSYTVGVTATDPAVTVHTGSAGATFVVEPSAPAPTPEAPQIALSPATQSSVAGKTLAYNLTLTNRDSNGSGASTFSLGYTVPAGWTGKLSLTSVSLAPGQSAPAILWVTSPANAAAGSYPVSVKMTDPSVAVHTATAGGNYQVEAPPTPTLTTPTGLDTFVKRNFVYLTWNRSTGGKGAIKYNVYRNGTPITRTPKTDFTDKVDAAGNYTYYVTATDSAGNTSAASSSVTVYAEPR